MLAESRPINWCTRFSDELCFYSNGRVREVPQPSTIQIPLQAHTTASRLGNYGAIGTEAIAIPCTRYLGLLYVYTLLCHTFLRRLFAQSDMYMLKQMNRDNPSSPYVTDVFFITRAAQLRSVFTHATLCIARSLRQQRVCPVCLSQSVLCLAERKQGREMYTRYTIW